MVMERRRSKKEETVSLRWPILAILLAAALVRILSIGYGLPYSLDAEEELNLRDGFRHTVRLKVGKLRSSDLSRSPLASYITAAEFGALYSAGSLSDEISSLVEYRYHFLTNRGLFIVTARLAGVIFGVLAVYMVYRICSMAFEWGVALVAAVLMAFSPHQILFSVLATGDIIALVFALSGLYFIQQLAIEKRFGSSLAAALMLGLAAGTSFNFAGLVVLLIIAYFVVMPGEYKRTAVATGLFLVLAFFAVGAVLPNLQGVLRSPLDTIKGFWSGALWNVFEIRFDSLERVKDFLVRLVRFDIFGHGVGWGAIGAGLLGLVWGSATVKFKKRRFAFVLLYVVLAAVVFFPWRERSLARCAFVMSPGLAIGAAFFIYRLFWRRGVGARFAVVMICIVTAAVAAESVLVASVAFLRPTGSDTRVLYAQWAGEDLPHGTRIATTLGGRFLHSSRDLGTSSPRWDHYRLKLIETWGGEGQDVFALPVGEALDETDGIGEIDYMIVDSWSEAELKRLASAPPLVGWPWVKGGQLATSAKRILARITEARATGRLVKTFPEPARGLSGYGPSIEVIALPKETIVAPPA